MQSIGWYVRRVRSMGPREILWRVRSLVRDQADVIRSKANIVPTTDVASLPAPADFRPGFRFDCFADASAPLELPDRDWGAQLVAKADAILDNRLSYFDLDAQPLGDPVDWHADLSAGKRGPLRHRTFVDYRDFDTYGDCKLVWEPNRHHQLVVLARCFKVTRDERYAEKAVALINDWCDANPFGYGMNWKSPMEVAIRNINWIFAIDLLLSSAALDRASFERIVQTIYLGTWDTVRRLSQGSSSNNHLIGEAAGVYIAACYFPQFREAGKWRALSKKILEQEITRQTYADGCTREHAFGYMFFVTQFEVLCMLAGQRSGDAFSAAFADRLRQMYAFLAELCSDSGRLPAVGDADDGYVVDLGDLPRDTRALISVGAELFDDDSLRLAERAETSFWLLGASQQSATSARRGDSVAFRDAGYFLLRSGAARDNEMSVFFDCAELGFGAIAAHGHADCLAVCVTVGGQEMLVDAGTYDYFTYPEWRNYFRSTRAHNTVEIDGEDQSLMTGPFMWSERANATLLAWEDDAERVSASGEHDGYRRLPDPVVHRRTLSLDKLRLELEIVDDIVAQGAHTVVRNWHLAAGCEASLDESGAVVVRHGSARLVIEAPGSTIELLAAEGDGFDGWVSDGYHRRAPSHCVRMTDSTDGNAQLRTVLKA